MDAQFRQEAASLRKANGMCLVKGGRGRGVPVQRVCPHGQVASLEEWLG